MNRTKLLAELLDLHLSRTINRHGADLMSSKLSIAAAKMREKRKAWDDRAQSLIENMDKLDVRANGAFEKHEDALSSAEAGFREMEDAIRDLEGANNPPQEGSGPSSDKSFPEVK